MGQTNEQQRHFNEWPISELHGELDAFQTSLKLLFILQQYLNVVSVFQLMEGVEHRVGRVLSFFPVVGIGTPPTPHPQANVPSPGEGHTRWRERGWESPNSDEGTYTVVLFIYMYFLEWKEWKGVDVHPHLQQAGPKKIYHHWIYEKSGPSPD